MTTNARIVPLSRIRDFSATALEVLKAEPGNGHASAANGSS